MKFTTVILVVSCLAGTALASTIFVHTDDSEVQFTLSSPPYKVISTGNTSLISGCAGSVGKERCPVFPILLPDLGSVINPFTEVSFIFNYESKQNSPIGNVDVYGLGRRASSSVLTNDYWTGTPAVDPTDATLLAQDVITVNSTDYGSRTVSGVTLTDYLNAQYAGGAGAGQYVFLRLSTDIAQTGGASRYVITSAEGVSDTTRPRLVYSTVMNGHSSDAEVQFTLSTPPYKVISDANTVLYSGSAGTVGKERCPVFPFQLPDFGAVAAPFTNTTSFIFNYEGRQNNPVLGNVDVYGLGRRANPAVLTNDYWTGTSTVDSTDATLIAQNVITENSTAYGLRTVGNSALIDYLNAQYASGAGAGQYVFLRLSTDAPQTGNANRYLITSSEGGTAQTRPQIIYNGDEVLNVRPFIWVRDSEKQDILTKISTQAWATNVYNGIVSRVASDVASHQSDRDAFIRQLPVIWTSNPPKFKTVPTYSRSVVIYPTEDLFNAGVDCALLYYLTGDESYARCAADILHNAVQALLPVSPSTGLSNGGWLEQSNLLYEARYLGTQLPIIYDFLYSYLQTHSVYDVDAAGDVSFSFNDAQTVFRTYYELVRDHGNSGSNWSALMSTCMLNNLLALDNDAERADALQIYLATGTSRQSSLAKDYLQYPEAGDIWPESLQYADGVGKIRTFHMVLLERIYPELNLFDTYPNLPISLPRIRYLRYPNNTEQITFGDGHRERNDQPFLEYEMVYRHAKSRGLTELSDEFGALINGGIADGEYNRSTVDNYTGLSPHNEPLQLLWQAESVTEPAESLVVPRTDRLPFAGIALQRNLSPIGSDHGLMAFVGGAAHIHSHASGMGMELYGMGQVMGAKSGRSTYGTTLHENYYRLFAANNTVIVNGASRGSGGWEGLGMNTVNLISMEPLPFAAAVSSNLSFTCSSFNDNKGSLAEATQQRTMAIVRTSPTTGFYVDFFRSRSTVTSRTATTLNGSVTDQYHDYIYRNIGVLNGSIQTNGVALPLYPQANRFQNDIGDTYGQPGWRYFTNTQVSYPHSASLRAQFKATPAGKSMIYMDMHMPEIDTREVAFVDSPPIVDAPAPYDNDSAPTLVVRKIGDAWSKPFVSVFEPHADAGGGTVQNTTTLWRSGTAVGVKVESIVGGSNVVHYVLSNTGDNQTYTEPSIGLSFTGRFGVIADYGNATYELYLGDGRSMSYRGNSMTSVSGSDTEASMICAAGMDPVVTANSPVNVVAASAPNVTSMVPASGNSMSFTLSGSMGVPYRFWSSTNLISDSWNLIQSGVVTENPFTLNDPAATNSAKFYRFSTP